MKSRNHVESLYLGIAILLAFFGVAQAMGPYHVVIEGASPPHSSSVVIGPGDSVDMQVVVLNVTDPAVAGSSLYLNYDPKVISGVTCIKSIFKDFNKCEVVEPGRFLFEGYDTFGKHRGDVVVEEFKITANASAPEGSSTVLKISGPRPGLSSGTPVWGPFWQEIKTTFGCGRLTIGQQPPSAGIQVNKTVYPSAGAPSTNATFNITVNNTGNSDLDNVTVADTLPEGMSYVSSMPVAGNVSDGVVTWSIGQLPPNSSPVPLELVAQVGQGARGELVNSVEAIGETENGMEINSSATANFTVIEAGIQVNKTVYPRSGAPSTHVTFNIIVNNTGIENLSNVTVVDTLPVGLSYLSSSPPAESVSGRVVTWNIGQLASNSSPVSFELVAKVERGASGELVNSVEARGETEQGGVVVSTATANFSALKAGIKVSKIACPKVAGVLFPVAFEIRVKNTGEIALEDVTLKDRLPPEMFYQSSTPQGMTNSRYVTWDLGTLEPHESRLVKLVAKIGFRAKECLKNEVIVEGTPISGDRVIDSGFAVVKVDRELNAAYINS